LAHLRAVKTGFEVKKKPPAKCNISFWIRADFGLAIVSLSSLSGILPNDQLRRLPVNIVSKWTLSLRKRNKNFLFDGDDQLFKSIVKTAKVYAEYGVGKSSIWVLQNTTAKVLAVDTSEHWINHVRKEANAADRFDVDWVNLGEIGWAGRPNNFERRNQFKDYIQSVWSRGAEPDLVLIDGRFRVACFLYSLAKANPGCTILFDDYTNRPNYHLVEEFLQPTGFCGRQGRFKVPEVLDREAILAEADRFTYVMD
jgi:hypothetical protein